MREGGEAVRGFAAGIEVSGVAEEFAAIVDEAVAVAVEHEQGVVGFDPAGGGLNAIAVVVEEDGSGGVDADGFETVVVEV
ncbi:MAG: hypothetical protein IPH08_05825 [Rhodocyclaceae bacterium]|nr:hypothetical protein [Rhodocyclaceae bacterium]